MARIPYEQCNIGAFIQNGTDYLNLCLLLKHNRETWRKTMDINIERLIIENSSCAIENFLKAILLQNKIDILKTHDINELFALMPRDAINKIECAMRNHKLDTKAGVIILPNIESLINNQIVELCNKYEASRYNNTTTTESPVNLELATEGALSKIFYCMILLSNVVLGNDSQDFIFSNDGCFSIPDLE
jgi:HEPN domain-containing protein